MSQSLNYTLHQLAFILDRQSDQALQARLGIGYSQYKILKALKVRPGVQQKEIAEFLLQTEASVSRQIKLMQAEGLLIARIHPENRRKRETILTEKGRGVATAAEETIEATHAQVYGSLSYQEQKLMKTLLDRMVVKAMSSDKKSS